MSLRTLQPLVLAIAEDPSNLAHKEKFIEAIRAMRFRVFLPDLAMFVVNCLETPDINHAPLAEPWYSMLRGHPGFRRILRLANKKDYASFRLAFEKIKDPDIFDSYFLKGLEALLVPDMQFEHLLTYLRRYCLERLQASGGSDRFADLAAPLAHYCFHSEYIFAVTPDEREAVAFLREEVEKNRPGSEMAILMFACYEPLHHLKNAIDIGKRLRRLSYADLVAEQIEGFMEERKVRDEIPSMTEIKAGVSQKVQAQYEAFPYPRWKSLASGMTLERLEAFLPEGALDGMQRDEARFLIAGCGTGLQALQCAMAFPKAEVIAIDLSRASLAYGLRKARERGIGNVRFCQADIMKLGATSERFDFIMCTGVLHHMADPEAGWAVLRELLNPGGLMRIALYSERARQFIVRTREVIAQKAYGDSREEIRRFRQDAPRILPKSDYRRITRTSDYYAMSECRDMLFHVEEHRQTIPEIAAMLDRLILDFLKFELSPEATAQYRKSFPRDTKGSDLTNWDRFEKKHPDLFLQMYRFWCRA